MSSDDGTFRIGSISRWIPIRSMTRIRNQGMTSPFSPMVSAALAKRCDRCPPMAITRATPPNRTDWTP
jgi:hypothetical protein